MPFSRLHYNEKLILRKVGNKHYTCTVNQSINQSINQSVNQQIFKWPKWCNHCKDRWLDDVSR